MSLSREATREICDYIREHSATLFGNKFCDCRFISSVQVQTKIDKFETKFLAISKFRVFLLSGKQFSHLKVERCFNVLALRHLNVACPEYTLSVGWEDRGSRSATLLFRCTDEKEAGELACEFLSSLKHYFPDIRRSLACFLNVSPPTLLAAFSLLPSSTPDLPCNNFRRSYVTYCDYNDLLYRDEVAWDVENMYFVHDIHEIRLDDFSHLPIKDQVAVISCAQFSSYFTGINADGLKLANEHVDAVLTVVRRSHALKSLSLIGCALTKDFSVHLASALQHNQTIPLEYLNLSNNNLDDKKGIAQLALALPRVHTLKSLFLNDCGLSEKSIHHLATGLYTCFGDFGGSVQNGSSSVLQSTTRFELSALHLSGNLLKDDTNELISFISLCNTLRVLDLSSTGFCVDKLWPALKLGGVRLERLHLAGCSAMSSSKKSGRDNLHAVVKELFSSMVNLNTLDLAGTFISADILQNILLGIINNNCISNISLNLSGVFEGCKGCSAVVEQHISLCPVANLSLRDNYIEHDAMKILPVLAKMRSLKRLDLGGANFYGLKSNKKYSATLSKVLREMGNLISHFDSHLEELVLSDCRLGAVCMSVILEPLSTTRLVSLDVTGNELGNSGARYLSKALQLNNSLRTLCLDRNQIGLEGFIELEHGLRFNHSLHTIPYPINDVSVVTDRAKIVATLAKMIQHLERNRKNMDLVAQCRQDILQSLINKSDNYNINVSNENKIIFHNLLKTVAELGNFSKANNFVNFDAVLDEFLIAFERVFAEGCDAFTQKFCEMLATRRIEILAEGRGANIFSTTALVQSESEETDSKVALKDELHRALENYITKLAWKNVGYKADALLRTPGTLKVRGCLSSNFTIDNSIHAVIIGSAERSVGIFSGGRRPNSMFHDSLVASLISGENSMEGVLLEENGEPSAPLIHLAKNRPRPARQFKNRLNTPLKQSSGSIATDDSFDYINDSISSSVKLERKSRQSSGGADSGNNQNLNNAASNLNVENSSINVERSSRSPILTPSSNNAARLPSTTPPPPLPRRDKSSTFPSGGTFGGMAPPKLPPKPSTDAG